MSQPAHSTRAIRNPQEVRDAQPRDGKRGALYSHDLHSVASVCHRIAILQSGGIVECGASEAIWARPRHSHRQRLLACAPRLQNPAVASWGAQPHEMFGSYFALATRLANARLSA